MITSKALALSLLLCSPLALARVQLNSLIEVDTPTQNCKRKFKHETQLDESKHALVHEERKEVAFKINVLAEHEDKVIVEYKIYIKKTDPTSVWTPYRTVNYDIGMNGANPAGDVSYSEKVYFDDVEYELVAAPIICATYDKQATVTIGQHTGQDDKADTLKITLNASKA